MTAAFLRHRLGAFPYPSRVVGAELHRGGAVDLRSVTEEAADAVVDAHGIQYRVHVRGIDTETVSTYRCSCRPTVGQASCHHVVATLLAIAEVLDEIESAAAVHAPDGAAAVDHRSRPRSAPTWRQRLAPVAGMHGTEAPLPSWIEYYVVPGDVVGAGALTVLVRERHRKKNGDLALPRASRVQPGTFDKLPHNDRLLLAALHRGQRRGFGGWYQSFRESVSLADPWILDVHEAALVLPLLKTREHVYHGPPPPSGAEPPRRLTIDVDEPFVFMLVPVAAEDAAAFDVHAVFRRGNQVLAAGHAPREESGYVIVEDRLIRTERHGASALHAEFLLRGPLRVPRHELPEMLAAVARSPGARHFLAAAIEHVPAEQPTGVVKLAFPTNTSEPLRAVLAFDYAGELVDGGSDVPLVLGAVGPRRRDFAAERRLHEQLAGLGLDPCSDGAFACARDRLAPTVSQLTLAGFRVLAEGRRVRSFQSGTGAVRSGIDWFSVEGSLEFAGHTATLPELLRGKVTPEGFVELGDGSLGMLPDTWMRRVDRMRLVAGEVDGDAVRVPASRALLLDAMLASNEESTFAIDAKFTAMRRQFAQFTAVQPVAEPEGFRGSLRPYQREGLGWLAFLTDFGLGGCLADDMGLGKTVQVLALLVREKRARKKKGERRPSAIVAPRSVLANWRAEAERFAPELRVVDFSGHTRWQEHGEELGECDLVLTTYGIVRADAPTFAERGIEFAHAILDEAQAIKNPDSQSAKAVRLLRARHRLVLTGTPVENHLGDLWSLFEFVNPGMLGRLPAFRALFQKGASDQAMGEHRELVQRALRPVLLRRTKAQVLSDLPEKVEQTVWCELGAEQRKRYDALRRHYQKKLLAGPGELGNDERFLILEALLRLRQAACHEGLLVKSRRDAASAKFDDLLERLADLAAEGHKALVFSQFTTLLDLLEPRLRERGIVWERLDGSTKNRAQRVARFQDDPQCPVFLISLKAGGYGLNLTAASYVFLLDPWWNPAVEMQAIDRAHRIGQKRAVNAYRLVCRDTVEERVLELQAQKKALCEAILGNERSLLQDLTRQDLELLLG